ncbi:MAG: hypothetical protein NVS3B26_08360 [Mycobacteriales bacterium]
MHDALMPAADPVLSTTFRLLTAACPDRVWRQLTCPAAAAAYLHGLSPRTCWTSGAPVEWHVGDAVIPGQVLHADPPHRLSVTVEDGSGTCTYLTWTVRACDDGSVVRLDVAEADDSGCEGDLEEIWLPVLRRLGELLEQPA